MTTWLDFGASNALSATVLAVVAWGIARLCRRPQVAFALWVLVLAKFLVPPLVGLPLESLRPRFTRVDPPPGTDGTEPANESTGRTIGLPQTPGVAGHEIPHLTDPAADASLLLQPMPGQIARDEFDAYLIDLSHAESPSLAAPLDLWRWVVPAVIGAWLAGSLAWFALAVIRIMRFRRLVRHALPAPAALEVEVGRLASDLGLRRVPRVRLVHRRVPPLVWAITGQATVLLPAELLSELSDPQRATLLAHELVHLKRRDHLVRWLELAALGVFWWHPVAWWARRNVERATEQCCDAEVIQLFPRQARSYAEALWTTIDFLSDAPSSLPLGASAFSQAGHVIRRMEMILEGNVARRSSRPVRCTLLVIGLTALPLSLRPLWADPTAQAVEEEAAGDAVAIEETQDVEFFVGAAEIDKPQDPPGQTAPTVEQRIERLEKMIRTLAERGQPIPAPAPTAAPQKQPTTPVPASPLSHEKLSGATRDDFDKIQLVTDVALADLAREAQLKLELSKTNRNRYEAAKRQFEAVKKAYEADTVTLDQLLESQRRVLEAYVSYVRNAAALAPDLQLRDLIVARASLVASNNALNDAREILNKIRQAGSAESTSEAQAREQYFQLKSQTSALLEEYQRAERAIEATQPKQSWGFFVNPDWRKVQELLEKATLEKRYEELNRQAEQHRSEAEKPAKAAEDAPQTDEKSPE